ncbi:MAG TPA: c-type cytochrome biogenesis protein CcmI [Phenylobacterium sp.]|uniref:c-type cytochrome biogenesis protein CcmI n=1 Tax=Phenylobacterium sp. TaxID=1871053 RepID=UPI002B467954|nr:c-type cytochrome biogenesis protein CcmI [Phenylobacterium sp.]HKR89736.1 c-type cytochrome biogenesis protein CcmI [Phenylobacterium sp.]
MIAFWVVAGVLAFAAAGLVLSRAANAAREEAVDPTPEVYRRQLAEIDDLAERGLIGEAERKGAYAEAGRRLLGAADAAPEAWQAGPAGRGFVMAAIVLASAGALAAYVLVGRPGMTDEPFSKRLTEWQAADPSSLNPPQLAAVLSALTRKRPNDAEAFHYLAVAEGAAQNPAEAVRAMRHAVRLAPERADLWELLGQALVAQADGEVTPEAQGAFRQALQRDPKSIAARFHLARVQIEAGDKAGGVAAWRALLADLPADDPRRPPLVEAIAQADGQPAGKAALPDGQLAMIQGMVQGLAQRLSSNPDDPEGWVRLVRAYAVLGETTKRDEALRQAKARYAGKRETLAQLDAAARAEPMR